MSKRNEVLLETSTFSSSQHLPDGNRRLSKRFRPLVQCNHIDKQNNEQCPADGFMECVHCDQICCLNHITQHQEELRQLRDDLVQEANEAYITLSEMQVNDTREDLQSKLTVWKKRMMNKIERIYEKLLDDVDESFDKVSSDFELKKKTLANEFDENVSTKLERLSTKFDFYPHELDELRLSVDDMYVRIRDARTSLIEIDYGNGNTYFLENDNSFQSPKLIIQTKPDIEQILNGSYLRQFHIEIENHTNLLYDTSNKHLLICNTQSNTLELYNHQERIGGGFWPKESSLITCVKWSSYLNRFLVLCSQSLYALNCSEEPFNMYPISQITPIEGNPMKYLSVNNDLMLVKHRNGIFIDNYSLKTMELIKRWTKHDFYPDENNPIDIHRMEFYTSFSLAMNIEINDDQDVLDFFVFPNIQHIRRIENAYLILYFPLNNSWLIKQRKDLDQNDLCLLEENGDINRLNLKEKKNLTAMKFFGNEIFLVIREHSSSIEMQLFPKL